MSGRSINVDVVADQIKIKDKILKFLQAGEFKKEVEQYCVYYHKCLQEKSQLKENFQPFILNLNLRFGEIVDCK